MLDKRDLTIVFLLSIVLILTACGILSTPNPTPVPPTATAEWTAYTITDPNRRPNEGLPDQWIDEISVALDGRVWVSTREAIANFDANGWHILHDISESIVLARWGYYGFAIGPDATIWLGISGALAHFDGEAWTLFGSEEVAAVYAQGESFTTVEDIPPFQNIHALAVDSEGTLWEATDSGLVRFDGDTWTVFRGSDDQISDEIFALTIAPDDTLWVGTDAGLSKFDGKQWTSYSRAGLFSTTLDSIAVATDGVLWGVAGDQDVFWFDGQRWGSPSALEELDIGIVWSIATGPNRTVWVGSSNGLTQFDGTRWAHYPLDEDMLPGRGDINASGIVALSVAPNGTVWCGTQRGVMSFRPPE